MSRQYRRWHKKKKLPTSCSTIQAPWSVGVSALLCVLLFFSVSYPRPCPWLSHPLPPRHYYLISRLIRKGNGRWRACLLRLEIRRKSSRGKRAGASGGGCEMISNVMRCAFLIKSLYRAFPQITSGASFIFLIYRRRKFSFFDLREPFAFHVFVLRLSVSPRIPASSDIGAMSVHFFSCLDPTLNPARSHREGRYCQKFFIER